MRYLWVVTLAVFAIAQQNGDNKKASKESDKKAEQPAPLFKHENLIASPHLGASTREAQEKVAIELAEVFVGFLKDGIVRNAVK